MPTFSPALITVMRSVLEDAMTQVPAEQATTVTKAYLAEFILKAARGAFLISVCAAQGRRHNHQVRNLRHDLGKKKHQGGRKDESDRYRDDVNAVVDWIGHRLGLSTSSKWRWAGRGC
jgi:hypothetical protein